MKLLAAISLLVIYTATSQAATGRIELRNTATSSSMCPSNNSACAAGGGYLGFGTGVTTEAYQFYPFLEINSGAMLRQRIVGTTPAGGTSVGQVNY